jgi:hypothetical protein
MVASNPSQQVESDSRSFENPLDSVKTDRALALIHRWDLPDFLYRGQSLAAGLVALAAAVIALAGAEVFARLKERRERKAILLSLAAEVRAYLDIFISKREIVHRISRQEAPVFGRDLKAVVETRSPIVFSASADRIGLLGPRIAAGLTEFYTIQEALNAAVRIVTTAPIAAVDRPQILELVYLFEQACKRALPLLAKLPHEKADADLKKKIETFTSQEPAAGRG